MRIVEPPVIVVKPRTVPDELLPVIFEKADACGLRRSTTRSTAPASAAPQLIREQENYRSIDRDQADLQKQIDEVKGALPKFAIPMREVGDRFQNIYYAAKDGNWALAAYMSKYMNGSMNPASVTKPSEYKVWKGFYDTTFAPVNKAIMAKDWKGFEAAYTAVITDCNGCHQGMGYGFIKVVKMGTPADNGIDYKTIKSEPGDVPK